MVERKDRRFKSNLMMRVRLQLMDLISSEIYKIKELGNKLSMHISIFHKHHFQ